MKKIVLLSSLLFSATTQALQIQPFGELLAWKADQSTAATWAAVITDNAAGTLRTFDVSNIDFNWAAGFRLGAMLHPEQPGFDSKLAWTHYQGHGDASIPLGNQLVFSEFFSGFYSLDVFFGGDIDWDIDMDMIDLQASHTIAVGDHFKFIPAMGIKAGRIDQQLDLHWNAIIYQARESVKNNFEGIGPSFSLGSQWNLTDNLAVIGNAGFAFMYGRWDVENTYNRPAQLDNLILPTTITTSMSDSKLGAMMYQVLLGLSWQHQGKVNLELNAGYELQFWANQLRLVTFQQLPTHGDLIFQGATCGVKVSI